MSEANVPTMTAAEIEEAQALQSEIFNLFQYIERFREEIARINASDKEGDDDAFSIDFHLETLLPELLGNFNRFG